MKSDKIQEVWERLADFWDQQIGEGNEFQASLIMPATDRLLAIERGQWVLDIACGNGNYSRRLGRMGARVVACDFCERFLQRAAERTKPSDGDIIYHQIDVTHGDQLLSLGENVFDAAVCSMALMDIPVVEPLLSALGRILKPGGRFVFSLPHPCFNSPDVRMTAELRNDAGKMEQTFGVAINNYIECSEELSSGLINQPEPHPFFHRPLSAIFSACFEAGFAMDGLEEPVFSQNDAAGKNPFSWNKRTKIPPVIVARMVR